MSNGIPDFNKRAGKSMLDWLIPQGMREDIQSPMMDLEGFYQLLQSNRANLDFKNEIPIPAQYGYQLIDIGADTSGGWEDFDDLMTKDYLSGRKSNLEDLYRQYMQNVNPLSPESVLGSLGGGIGRQYLEGEGTAESLTPEMVNPLKLKDLQGLHTGAYTKDYLTPQRQALEDSYLGKKDMISSFGSGIAGYGKRKGLEEKARSSFLSGVENIYSNIDQFKSSAMQRIYDAIDEWSGMTSFYGGD